MDFNKDGNGVSKVLLMNRIFRILCAFVVIASGLSPTSAMGKPEIFVQLGHSGVQSIVFSSDGKYVLSGGDKTVKLWDTGSGIGRIF